MILIELETRLKKEHVNTKITLKEVFWAELWPFKVGLLNRDKTEFTTHRILKNKLESGLY